MNGTFTAVYRPIGLYATFFNTSESFNISIEVCRPFYRAGAAALVAITTRHGAEATFRHNRPNTKVLVKGNCTLQR